MHDSMETSVIHLFISPPPFPRYVSALVPSTGVESGGGTHEANIFRRHGKIIFIFRHFSKFPKAITVVFIAAMPS